jgi:uncharacterized protein YuzE
VEDVPELAKAEVRMAVDPFRVIAAALRKAGRSPRSRKLVSVDYDEQADVLYARFSYGRIADSKALDENGMIMASLDSNDKIVGLVVMHASNLA